MYELGLVWSDGGEMDSGSGDQCVRIEDKSSKNWI